MYNTIVTAGRLASDTDMREVSSNKVCKFRMCISSNRSKEPCFIDVEMWGRQAEIAHEHLEKGRLILVQGEIRYSSWENEGKQYSKMFISGNNFTFLGGAKDADSETAPKAVKTAVAAGADEDIPF